MPIPARRARHLLASALAMLLSVASIAAAPQDGFTPVGDPLDSVFDAADGRYQEIAMPAACPANAIRGTVRFLRYGRPTTEFVPGINIFLFTRDHGKYVRLGFHAADFHPPFTPTLNAGPAADGSFTSTVDYTTRVGADGSFAFLITWTGNGTVTAVTGNESHTNQLGERPASILIRGFSGSASVTAETGRVRIAKDDPCLPTV